MSKFIYLIHDIVSKTKLSDDEDEILETNKKEEQGDGDAQDQNADDQSKEDATTRAREQSLELHIYTVEELSRFKKKELLADVTYLEGNLYPFPYVFFC